MLPANANAPAYPFGGLVINFNVCTDGHRDVMDDRLCVVIPLGDFEGGELVIYEASLVFDARPGEAIIFRSTELTHFNLHYRGVRASLVLHSDKHGKDWVENRNEWNDHLSVGNGVDIEQ